MKTSRLIVVLMVVACAMCMRAQTLAQHPEIMMQSTSVLAPTGTTLPQAAVTGTHTADAPMYSGPAKVGPRRIGEDSFDSGDTPPTKPTEPLPIGEGLWVLMALAFVFGAWKWGRRVFAS